MVTEKETQVISHACMFMAPEGFRLRHITIRDRCLLLAFITMTGKPNFGIDIAFSCLEIDRVLNISSMVAHQCQECLRQIANLRTQMNIENIRKAQDR